MHTAVWPLPRSISRALLSPPKEALGPSAATLHFLTPSTWQRYILCLRICLFWTFPIIGIIQCGAFVSDFFTQLSTVKPVAAVMEIRSFLRRRTFHCVDLSYAMFTHPSAGGHLGFPIRYFRLCTCLCLPSFSYKTWSKITFLKFDLTICLLTG